MFLYTSHFKCFDLSFIHCSAPLSRIPAPGLSSSGAKVQQRQRHIRKSQNRTYSYLQAVDKDFFLSGDSEGSSDGSRNTSPHPGGSVPDSSEGATAENADENTSPLSQRKPLKVASDQEHGASSGIPVAASMRRRSEPARNEENVSLQNDSRSTENELQSSSVSEKTTSPWRKGRVSELRAVFAKKEEGTVPPRPDSAYLSASGRPLSTDESSSFNRHPVHKDLSPAIGDRVVRPNLVGSNRFGYVSSNVPRSARLASPVSLGHGGQNAKMEVARSPPADLNVHTNAEKQQVGLSVRDRTANWERRRSGIDFDTASHAAKPTLNTTHSHLSGSKAEVGNQTAASAAEVPRRKSAGDTCHLTLGGAPVLDSVSSTKGEETMQMDKPVSDSSAGKPTSRESTEHFSNLPSYAHRFSTSDRSRSSTPMAPSSANNRSSLSPKRRLDPKLALQANSNNNNAYKGVLRSHVETNPSSTKLPMPTSSQSKVRSQSVANRSLIALRQVSSAQQPLPKPRALTHHVSTPILHLRSQGMDYNQSEDAELVQPKQSMMQRQATISETQGTTAVDCPSPAVTPELLTQSFQEGSSSTEAVANTQISDALAKGNNSKERDSPAEEECLYPTKINEDEEVSAVTSRVAFERQLSADSQAGSMGNFAVSPAMPPQAPQVCMDDISSDEGSLEVRMH